MKRFLPTLALGSALLFSASAAYSATIVAQYKLDGNANDASGNSYHGADTDVSYVADGTFGTVGQFNGTSSTVDTTNGGSNGLSYSLGDTPNGQFSISMWIKPTLVNADNDANADTSVILGGSGPGKGVIEIVGENSWAGMGGGSAAGGVGVNSGGGGGKTGNVDTIDLYDGDWHHVVIQWAGDPNTDIQVWIDNSAATTYGNGYNGSSNATTAIRLGGPATWSNGGVADKYYTGQMADVRFYDAQLTAQEVSDIYNNVPEPGSLALLGLGGLLVARRRRG